MFKKFKSGLLPDASRLAVKMVELADIVSNKFDADGNHLDTVVAGINDRINTTNRSVDVKANCSQVKDLQDQVSSINRKIELLAATDLYLHRSIKDLDPWV